MLILNSCCSKYYFCSLSYASEFAKLNVDLLILNLKMRKMLNALNFGIRIFHLGFDFSFLMFEFGAWDFGIRAFVDLWICVFVVAGIRIFGELWSCGFVNFGIWACWDLGMCGCWGWGGW